MTEYRVCAICKRQEDKETMRVVPFTFQAVYYVCQGCADNKFNDVMNWLDEPDCPVYLQDIILCGER